MSPRLRGAIRFFVVAGGLAVTLAAVLALRLEDWPTYVVFVLLALALFSPAVEVLPGLALPMPSLALSIGFLYVGGLPIVLLRNAVPPTLPQLLRWLLPARWQRALPNRFWLTEHLGYARGLHTTERSAVAADWASFSLGLGVRWWVVSLLVADGAPARHPEAILAAEMAGYACWTLLTMLPIFSFSPVLFPGAHGPLRHVHTDLALIMAGALTPFVFLIAYGYAAHGLGGATAWSLASLGLHFMLKEPGCRSLRLQQGRSSPATSGAARFG
jgi:hypothetical protein